MYAIVQIGQSQYMVKKGDTIAIDRLDDKEGKSVNFDKVILLCSGKSEVNIGQPYLKGIKVNAEVLRHFDGKKKIAFKYKRRKHYYRKHGHRQLLTQLKIIDISEK
ncbi:MAG: 50S ribosomal protein L21 [Candidatus Omnitrophota bacterium]|nr:50S ribosomal protein L21 [Candidatus Omnitrophota bacterium]